MNDTARQIPDELIDQAKRVDLRSLAERYTLLHRESPREMSGPCPRCRGSDRFHVAADWFFCRQCHSERGDSIAFLRWVQPGLSFRDAVAQLTGGAALPSCTAAPRRPHHRAAVQQSPDWQRKNESMTAEAHTRLWTPDGEPGRAYLLGRCLESSTWLAFGLGFRPDAPLPRTGHKQTAPAIVLPWRSPKAGLFAVRYRFLEVQHYIDKDGAEKDARLVSESGSAMASRLFGGQALPQFGAPEADRRPIESLRWLLLVEGEFNCMSCWQAAGESLLDVLSIGSESAHLSDGALQFAARYSRVLVWADKHTAAAGLMAALPGAYGICSPGGQDANDLLRAGKLGGFLALARADAAQSTDELERLLWALRDAADTVQGIDAGQAQVCLSLAGKLGKSVDLAEVSTGRWTVRERPEGHAWAPAAGDGSEKPVLPAALSLGGIATWGEAWAAWRHLSERYRAALGRNAAGYFVSAPGAPMGGDHGATKDDL